MHLAVPNGREKIRDLRGPVKSPRAARSEPRLAPPTRRARLAECPVMDVQRRMAARPHLNGPLVTRVRRSGPAKSPDVPSVRARACRRGDRARHRVSARRARPRKASASHPRAAGRTSRRHPSASRT
jgi:hypothetical protein